jgi:hypothetical protein
MRNRKNIFWMAVVAIAFPVVTNAGCGDGWLSWHCQPLVFPCLCCPNDYCHKPLPVSCPTCFCGPNDYCGKPLPCTLPFCNFGCNDYCGKPLPKIVPCYVPPGATCGPPDQPVCPCNACPNGACANGAGSMSAAPGSTSAPPTANSTTSALRSSH